MKTLAVVETTSEAIHKGEVSALAQGPTPFTVAWALMDLMDVTALRTLAEVSALRLAAKEKELRK